MGSQVEHQNKYQEIVDGLKNNSFSNILFITGAGISTAAGIVMWEMRNRLNSNIDMNQ